MKHALFLLILGQILFVCCTGIKTTSSGLENDSYLEFVGKSSNYVGGVDVTVDDLVSFKAVVFENKGGIRGKLYAIPSGKHVISIYYKGELIVKREIFLSAQETKKILLP